jgi:hypothetical protein
MTEADYIGANLPNFVATVQTRAVQALAAIGGREATDVLRAALRDHRDRRLAYRDDVVEAIESALATM